MMEFILKALPGVITAVFASYLAAKWSLKRFYSEKLWERKEHAYVEIIDALYDLLQYCEIQKGDYGQGTGYSKENEDELRESYNQAYWKIKKATDIGAFVVSPQAETVLKELRERPRLEWEENPIFEIYEQDYNYYKDALTTIVRLAKQDLNASKA